MAIAFKRSIRQAISFVVGGAAAWGTWTYTREAMIFHAFQGGANVLPALSAIAAFVLAYWIAMTFISGKAAH